MMEKIILADNMDISGTISCKSVKLPAYPDNIDIIGISKRAVIATLSSLEKKSRRVGLAVNEVKTKKSTRIGQQVAIGNYEFGVVETLSTKDPTLTRTLTSFKRSSKE